MSRVSLKNIFVQGIPIILLICLPAALFAGQFKVTRVYDGDTVRAEGHGIEIKVRLVGVDAPEASKGKREPGQPFSRQTTNHLAGLILNKTIDIKGYGLCPYNRILGVIFLDGRNINLEMVKAGLAEFYRGSPPHGFELASYLEAEQKARDAKRGMWSQGGKYVSPKDWRRLKNG